MAILKLGPLHSSTTESLERDNGLEGVIKMGRNGGREGESRKMMIMLASQHYGTAETEIMVEGETCRI